MLSLTGIGRILKRRIKFGNKQTIDADGRELKKLSEMTSEILVNRG